MYPANHPVNMRALWEQTEARRAEYNRRWEDVHDRCKCQAPVRGPRYLKVTRCVRCARVIR